MPNLFGIDIAGILATNLASGLLPATLTKVIAQIRTPGALTAGVNPESADYPCRGLIEDYNETLMSLTQINVGDKRIMLLGGTLPSTIVPSTGDYITIESNSYTIISVQRDPAAATYTCQARGSLNG